MATTFEITLEQITAGYADGDRIEVYADVENVTASEQTGTLVLNVDGVEQFSRDITLPAGDVTEYKLAWTADITSNTTKAVTATTSNDSSESQDVTLRLYDDVIRTTLDPGEDNWVKAENYISSADSIGPDT